MSRLFTSATNTSALLQHHRCVANFFEIVKGFGMFPNKYAQVGTAVHCLLRPSVLSRQNGKGKFFAKSAKLIIAKIAECTYTCCACYSSFPHNSKCHFLKWKSAATAALSAQKRNGRKLYYSTTNYFEKWQDFFICSTHRVNKDKCSGHYIRAVVLEQEAWKHIQEVISVVTRYEAYFRSEM